MSLDEKTPLELQFSKEAIYQQLERIFLNPVFIRSEILRRFLSFIVDETIEGHSSWLKEYTIAVNVLNKPADFKPREDCIVRIHAGRLRRALHRYYHEKGAFDPLHISIPKGSYIPVFQESCKTIEDVAASSNIIPDKSSVVAVIPFSHVQNNSFENSLADGLGLQLCSALMHLKYFSVIAYYITRNLAENSGDIREITQSLDATYIITGDIQSMENRVRIYIQLVHTTTNKQVWSQMFDRKITAANIFEIQDEIVEMIVPELEKACNPKQLEFQNQSMMAIA